MNLKMNCCFWIPVLLYLFCLAIFPGCGKSDTDQEASKKIPIVHEEDAHDNAHQEASHGGTLLGVGDHTAHLEIVHDHEQGKFLLYVTGQDMKTPLNADNPPLINIKTADGPKQIETRAVEGASTFEAEHPDLKGDHLEGQVVLTVNGKSYYLPLPCDHPHGEENGHTHGEEDGHAHGEDNSHAHDENIGHEHGEDCEHDHGEDNSHEHGEINDPDHDHE